MISARRLACLLLPLCLVACGGGEEPKNSNSSPEPPAAVPRREGPPTIVAIETDLGTIKVQLLEDEAPQTALNFRQLVARSFYDGVVFHRTIRGFMIQGGDPTGTGMGGQTARGGPIPNEVNADSELYRGGYQRGLVAMANKGTPESATSQFFIMHQNYRLPPNYTIFGKVIEGMEVVDQIAVAPTTGPSNDSPIEPVAMKRVYIESPAR